MSLYQDDDSQQADTEEFNEFEHYRKPESLISLVLNISS